MNANVKLILSALLALTALSACSSTGSAKLNPKLPTSPKTTVSDNIQRVEIPPTLTVESVDSTREVAYRCNQGPLTVMYGIKDNEVVVAQAKFKNELTPNLNRVTNVSDFNAFWGNGISWATDAANAANITKVDGNLLTQVELTTVNGQQIETNSILLKGCVLDKVATTKLNRARK